MGLFATKIARGLILVGIATLGAGWLGQLHGIGDSLAVLRLPLALGVLAMALVALGFGGRGLVALGGLAVSLVAAVPIVAGYLGSPAPGPVTVYQKNMLFLMQNRRPLAGDILETRPDFVTLQEVTAANRELFELIASDYPAVHWCAFRGVGGPAVAARWPLVPGSQRCPEGGGMAAMQVLMPHGPVWIVSLHLHWPWPYGQADQVAALLADLAALDGTVVVGGDFNMVPWSHSLRAIMAATRTRRAGRVATTLVVEGVPLPIDHVLAPGSGAAETRPRLGSDHLGVLARVGLEP